MKFGVLKDIKNGEYRVIATPAEIHTIASDGNEVFVQHNAGLAAALPATSVYSPTRSPAEYSKDRG